MNPLRTFLLNLLSKKKHNMPATGWDNAKLYFSQFGEDVILQNHMDIKKTGFYVDVGCFDPAEWSSTYLLYLNNWHGIAIDPNNDVIEKYKEHRPKDIAVCAGIAETEQTLDYYQFHRGVFNTFSKEVADKLEKGGIPITKTNKVKTYSLETILDKHLPANTPIKVMNVDCEGYDLVVLQSNNWDKYKPEFILAEDHGDNLNSETTDYLSGLGYKMVNWVGPTKIFKLKT